MRVVDHTVNDGHEVTREAHHEAPGGELLGAQMHPTMPSRTYGQPASSSAASKRPTCSKSPGHPSKPRSGTTSRTRQLVACNVEFESVF
jgi:hypothetical protein